MAKSILNEADRGVLRELYQRSGKTADELPYTEEFELLYASFLRRTGLGMTRNSFWRLLANERKQGKLARKRRDPGPPVTTHVLRDD